jgi:hypothetical protein
VERGPAVAARRFVTYRGSARSSIIFRAASNFAGGRYYDNEGEPQDAKRIIINRGTGVTWYSPNHYTDFFRL